MTGAIDRAAAALPKIITHAGALAHDAAPAAATVAATATATTARTAAQPAAVAGAHAGAEALRIGIVGNGDLSWGAKMVHDVLTERGHVPVYMPYESFTADAAGAITSAGAPVPKLDALMVRVGAKLTDDGMAALRRIEASGVPVLSPPDSIELARSKWGIASTLQAAGLPHPRTALITKEQTGEDVAAALAQFDGGRTPVVIKPNADMGGHGVVFQEHSSQVSMRSVADALMDGGHRDKLVVQEWLKEGTGRDLRAYFVRLPDGDVHIAPRGIERFGGEGKGQANLSSGGSWSVHELPSDVQDMARRGAEAFKLDFGSVDFVRGPKGYQVIEVNSAAGLEPGIPEAIGSPMDQQLADLAIDAARNGRVNRGAGSAGAAVARG